MKEEEERGEVLNDLNLYSSPLSLFENNTDVLERSSNNGKLFNKVEVQRTLRCFGCSRGSSSCKVCVPFFLEIYLYFFYLINSRV